MLNQVQMLVSSVLNRERESLLNLYKHNSLCLKKGICYNYPFNLFIIIIQKITDLKSCQREQLEMSPCSHFKEAMVAFILHALSWI